MRNQALPADWPETRLRQVVTLNPSRSEVAELARDAAASFVPMDAIGETGTLRLDTTRPLSEVEQGYTCFCDGDVLIAKITPCFENGKGAVAAGLTNGIGFGTTELIVVRPKEKRTDAAFLYWLFSSSSFRHPATAAMFGAGGQKRVPDDFVKDFRLALPPISEQREIAAFLDRETAKIDDLIAQQERLIELLEEKKQATISHAVTKGLDPSVPMERSGISWVGLIPKHWNVRKVKSLATFITSGPRGWSERVEAGGSLFIQSGDMTDRLRIDFGNAKRMRVDDVAEAEAARTRLNTGDVLVCITGAKTGKVAICSACPEAAYLLDPTFKSSPI